MSTSRRSKRGLARETCAARINAAIDRHRLATWGALRDALREMLDAYEGGLGDFDPSTFAANTRAHAALDAADREPAP